MATQPKSNQQNQTKPQKSPEELKKQRADVDESGARNVGTIDKKSDKK